MVTKNSSTRMQTSSLIGNGFPFGEVQIVLWNTERGLCLYTIAEECFLAYFALNVLEGEHLEAFVESVLLEEVAAFVVSQLEGQAVNGCK